MDNRLTLGSFLLLVVVFMIYSVTGVVTKLASYEIFLSFDYLLYLGLVLLSIGVYAILWQVILKKVPLSQAFLFKSMTVLFTLIFAFLFFAETITWKNAVGAAFIMLGIIVNSFSTSKA